MDYFKTRFNWAFAATLIVSFIALSRAASGDIALADREVGTEICACAPNAYEFTLDFALTCPPVNITLGDAVSATTCMVSPFGSPEVADLVPVSVSSIDILELNQNLQVMVQENIEPKNAYVDGDTFSYISYAAIPGEVVNPEDLPRAIQLNIVGKNRNGEEIINVYLITFTNSCGAYPVLFEGQWAGWTRFKDLGPPNPDLCPAARVPTPSPVPYVPAMSMSMSMDMISGFESLSIEDLLDENIGIQDKYQKKQKSEKSKSGKSGKSEKGEKKGKFGKPHSQPQKEIKKNSNKEANKLSKSKDGKASGKDGKAGGKDGKAEKNKSGGKDGKADEKEIKADGKDGKANGKDGKAGKSGKSAKSKSGGKAGGKDGDKLAKSGGKDGGKGKFGKSIDEKMKEANKLRKSAVGKDGKAGKAEEKAGGKRRLRI
mmetsp:Transcript_16517/g.34175  ORF Transcript_16517/g.34175 Transcript_16517/m.34175 type:complete len:430 (-) Transcript_16517:174-1463(-)|eukprot:CAMPEP_0201142794 /NCGR_PEP_ID=MMETSP0851-20130426/4481_1 /ASSEMBLY_ACC=CAM_ASM_000631 /TAXON_ID=183588 /ORGANISM="Pseudo-nitzschia fraudulenta, Strain WWA7" /LENGTH=429 /DNA_ID=CAMNT_0047416631 /DNA_START=88 /DNA_END=1377 /DNA_ORIENTATION=+